MKNTEWSNRYENWLTVFALGEDRTGLTTRDAAELASVAKSLRFVSCKIDSRGRMTIPKEFRHFFYNEKIVSMSGKGHKKKSKGKNKKEWLKFPMTYLSN